MVRDTDESLLKRNLQSRGAVGHETIHCLPRAPMKMSRRVASLLFHDARQILGALLFFHWATRDAHHVAAGACVIEIGIGSLAFPATAAKCDKTLDPEA
jgi:hypothetical protein